MRATGAGHSWNVWLRRVFSDLFGLRRQDGMVQINRAPEAVGRMENEWSYQANGPGFFWIALPGREITIGYVKDDRPDGDVIMLCGFEWPHRKPFPPETQWLRARIPERQE